MNLKVSFPTATQGNTPAGDASLDISKHELASDRRQVGRP